MSKISLKIILLAKADGNKIIIHCNKDNKLERIIQKFCSKIKKIKVSYAFYMEEKLLI